MSPKNFEKAEKLLKFLRQAKEAIKVMENRIDDLNFSTLEKINPVLHKQIRAAMLIAGRKYVEDTETLISQLD